MKSTPSPIANQDAIEIEVLFKTSIIRYSICTLVNDLDQYNEMLASFHEAGFSTECCEYIYIDNSKANRYDGYQACNLFLTQSQGEYIVLCHQDVRLHDHRREDLERIIAQLSTLDPEWGVLGNAGGVAPGQLAIRITDPKGQNTRRGEFPARVHALDENFMVVRRAANLAVSRDIGGYHFYGTDLCILAEILGYGCYVVDFHLHHLGGASTQIDKARKKSNAFMQDYHLARRRLIDKYRRALAPRWVQNTGTLFLLTSSRFWGFLAERKIIRSLLKRLY